MGIKETRGFTLIELIITIVIISILSVSGVYVMTFLIQSAVFIPNQLNMDMLASDILDIIVEGDTQAGGLRFSRSITNIQPNQVTFNDQNDQSVDYSLNGIDGMVYRSINGGASAIIPSYATSAGVTVTGNGGQIFRYYDANEAITAAAPNVRRISLDVSARTGNGEFNEWMGQSNIGTAVAVNSY